MSLLNILISLPILIAVLLSLISNNNDNSTKKIKIICLLVQVLNLALTIVICQKFDFNKSGFQLEENYLFSNIFRFNYHLAIDGISLIFVVLVNILMPIILIANWCYLQNRVKEYIICLLIMQGLTLGSFLVVDLAVFYFFFEFMLIPMYIIIGIWGGENRVFAATKFFLYTLTGSMLLLAVIIFLYSKFGSVDYDLLLSLQDKLTPETCRLIWFGLFISFAVKIPMVPLHSWLPDAHVQAPSFGSMILAGILLKIGGYAMLRFLLPIFPEMSQVNREFVIILSIIAVIYTSLIAFAQKDMKKTIAYSSIAHMGYVTAGIFSNNLEGISGSVFQMFSHGLISPCLFYIVAIIYEKLHTKQIDKLGSIARFAPNLAIIMMIMTMASVGLPGTSGFVGEALVLFGAYKISPIYAALLASGMVLGAVYMLNLYKKVFYGEEVPTDVLKMTDINLRELSIFAIFVVLVIIMGIYPNILLNVINITINDRFHITG